MLLKFRGAGGIQNRIASPVIDPPSWKNTYQGGALDLAVNVAIAVVAVVAVWVLPIDPTIWKSRAPQIDVYPNLAVKTETVPVPRAPLYITRPTPPP